MSKVQKRAQREKQQQLDKAQRKAEKRRRPLPGNPLERLNVLTQRLGIHPPDTHTTEHRSFAVTLVCKRLKSQSGISEGEGEVEIIAQAEGHGMTVKEAKLAAAQEMSKILEQCCTGTANGADGGEEGEPMMVEDTGDVAAVGRAVEVGMNSAGKDVAGQDMGVGSMVVEGDDVVDWDDDELISYD